MSTRFFDFHDVSLAVSSGEEAVAAAVAGRLRHFAVDEGDGRALRFDFQVVTSADAHDVCRPATEGRPVYDPPAGEVSFFDEEDRLYIDYEGRVRVDGDAGSGSVRISVVDGERGNLWLLSRPMFTLPFVELLKRRGLFSVHAAGVAVDGRAVLIAGPSGAGKSTLAVALARAGLGFLGDDMLFLHRNGDGVTVLSFPDEVDVASSTAAWFPELAELASCTPEPGWSKHRLRAEDVYGSAFVAESKPAVVLFPRIGGKSDTTVTPMSPEEALLELAPNVLLTEQHSSQAHLHALGELVRVCDLYRVEVGRDFERIPSLVADLAA